MYHESQFGDMKVNLLRNVFDHWVRARFDLSHRTDKQRKWKLAQEKKRADGETLKQKRERIKREEVEAEEAESAPKEVEDVFDMFDQDEDGAITKADLAVVAGLIGTEVLISTLTLTLILT